MSEIIRKLELFGADPAQRDTLSAEISRHEIEALIQLNPTICAFEHNPDQPGDPDNPGDDCPDEDSEKTKNVKFA